MPLRLAQDTSGAGGFDLVNTNGLEVDDGLEAAVIVSLFTDARATDDELAAAGLGRDDNRGCWQDTYADDPQDVQGSKLWLLTRALKSDATLARGKQYAEDALKWLVTDEVALSVTATAAWLDAVGHMKITIDIVKRDGQRWQGVWDSISARDLRTS